MQQGMQQPAIQNNALELQAAMGFGENRGCISQFISKGKERACAIIITVRQTMDSQLYEAQLQPQAEWRELKAGETFLLLLEKRQ